MEKDKRDIVLDHEQVKIKGGFILHKRSANNIGRTQFFADNENCPASGWFDSNTNCNNACADCKSDSSDDDDDVAEDPNKG
ncbi:MAG: hypothetical protein K2G52_09775 [Muribaculaceae bacterium]|nr:hypothetical protein [Muribaculaceae bacterium]